MPQDEKEKLRRVPTDHGGLNGADLCLNFCTHIALLTKQLIQVMKSFHVVSNLASVLLLYFPRCQFLSYLILVWNR